MNKRHYSPFVFNDHIGHFLKPLDVLGITPKLRVSYCNLPFFFSYKFYFI